MNLNKLNPECYEEFEHETVLTEEDNNVRYQLKVRLKVSSKQGIYINLPLLKKLSKYLQADYKIANPPKDCDAIIIDKDSNIAYLIEMKRSSNASTNERINEQLSAGMKWLEHICFCTDTISGDYRIIKVAVMIESSRRSRSRGQQEGTVIGYDFYRKTGNSLALEFIS
ncbi:hypothetical protein A7K91_21465 [Paenibacillus oryzae]|uniref:Uncharacterized protein n=1 Tax=Paenibacillus oryzae TaxID=1844972 RepID=A0A1A5YS49_9BACL|nr:hypothetical protein [Paenibacillus oryzae]OBR68451.1 hypothetical protein A7K91_21465 [Paenibacillus oryzae]